MQIKNRHNHPQVEGGAILQFLQPGCTGYRQKLSAAGKEVKNHMKSNRQDLFKTSQANWKKKEEQSQQQPKDAFKMKQFQNVQSKIKLDLLQQSARGEVRPQTAFLQSKSRLCSARRQSTAAAEAAQKQKLAKEKLAFGRGDPKQSLMRRTGSFSGNMVVMNNDLKDLRQFNQNILQQFNRQGSSGALTKDQQVEQALDAGKENDQPNIIMTKGPSALPPRTPNYGKTPNYIKKFKVEAIERETVKAEEKAAAKRPAGTRLVEGTERIEMLEELNANKKKVLQLLTQMPISMRTESLKKHKCELEKKLTEIERAIEKFERKVIFIKDD